jgi:hypothetical protein
LRESSTFIGWGGAGAVLFCSSAIPSILEALPSIRPAESAPPHETM